MVVDLPKPFYFCAELKYARKETWTAREIPLPTPLDTPGGGS